MGLTRAWLRGLLGATGAVIIVPLGLVLAVALAASVGGGGVGGLGQLAAGPTLPGADPVARALGPSGPSAPGGVPAVPRSPTTETLARDERPTSPPARRRTDGAPRREGDRDRTPAPRPEPTDDGPDPPVATTPPPAAPPTPAPPSGGAPTPPGNPVTDLVRGVGDVADAAVRPLPAVGPPVADAVGTVIDLVAGPREAAPAPPLLP